MKISVLTPTYNRAKLLKNLYNSLIDNSKYDMQVEWLIMDDGSTDDTKKVIESFKEKANLEIKYMYQENSGKMTAINRLVEIATGDLIVDCDSDDYFTNDAFKIIKETYDRNKANLSDIYGFCYLKYDTNGNNMGNSFKKEKTTMFDLYFKEGETGEKALVFIAEVRKKYKHKLEHGEKFVTEARLYHEMDLKYKMICENYPIMICEYQQEGYTKNIIEQFKQNPYGYYEYFKEILKRDMKGVTYNKRIYAIKHLLYFGYLTKVKKIVTRQNILYVLFGVMTTLVNIGISTLLFKVFNIEGNISSIIGIVFSILFAYFTNRILVFNSDAKTIKGKIKEFTKFMCGRLITLGIEAFGVFVFFSLLNIDFVLTKLLMTIIVVIINYYISKNIVFKK